MLNNLSNNNSGNATKSVVERKHYEDIEKRLDEMQGEIEMTEQGVSTNSQAIASLDGRVDAVENNSTFPTLNTDTINPATGDKIDVTGNVDVDGEIEANSVKTNSLSVNGTSFTTVKNDAAQAKSTAETAKNKADEAYDLADAVADELADYKADNEASITTGTLNADSVVTDSIAAQTINTNDFETTNAEIDKLYVDTIKATGFLELPTTGQSYYTITVPAKTTASFSGIYTSDNNTDYHFYFTVSDGAVIYKQNSTEIIKDISFDRETGSTKVRVKSSTNLTYISSALDNNPVTIEDGGNAYTDYVFIPQKTGGYLIRGYDDTTTEVYIAGVLKAYALSIEEEIIERTSVDFLKVNASIELPKDWDAGGTISYSTGEENQYISAQKKAGVTKPTWTSPIHSTIGSLSYSSKLVDEATVASYKGISETRQTQTISITDEASLQQLTAFHWTKNGNYWQPYEVTRITIGDHTMWIDPTESNQGIRFYDNQVIADGTWDDVPVEEANAVPVNLVIFDAPTELSFPITNLGDKTTVHGEITATCFKGNVLGNVTGNADTATNATCFDNKTYAEAKADILSGCAADSDKFNGKTYSEACADILSGNAATATNATCFDGCTYAQAKADILSGCAASADNATCFDGCTYAQAKADILSGNAASATNATCFGGCTYSQAKADIRNYTPSYATCTLCPIIHATDDTNPAQHVIPFAKYAGSTNDQTPLNCDNSLYYVTVSKSLTTPNLCVGTCAEITSAHILCLQTYNTIDGKASKACCSNCAQTVYTGGSANTQKLLSSTCGWSTPNQTCIDYNLGSNTLSNANIDISGCSLKAATGCFTGNVEVDCNVNIGGDLNVAGTITTTHSEEVITPSENILLRDGATAAIPSGHYSGFTVTNYDGHNNNLEVGANSDGTLHIGTTTGTMEPVATRACEACMEDGYAVHWDSTGTDLVTKGATNTHDLTVNGNASTTGNLSVTGNATVTGTLTADLTGTADNATCFGGCTYSEAKTDILSGCAASADNATCFDGCTYAQACADILSGCASKADNATCFGGCTYSQAKTDILSGCAADSAKLGNKAASCYIDTSSTAQTKAGNLSIGAPAACTSTSAGGAGVLVGSYGALQIFQDTPTIDLRYHKYCGEYSARLGNTAKGRFHIGVNDGEGCTGSSQSAIYCFCSDGTFTGATNICGTNIYQNGNKVIDTSSTAQCKSGTLNIGNPSAATSTTAGSQGTSIHNDGTICLFSPGAPYINLFHCNACAFSSRIVHGHDATNNNGHLCLWVRNTSNTSYSNNATYDFSSNGTFTGASTICASCNIYSAGCPVVTTGNIATVAPGYNCTGTSNYVVTTMVCCAKGVCRNQATTGTCHLALFDGKTAIADADMYVSNACELTYEPATGTMCNLGSKFGAYQVCIPSTYGATKYVLADVGSTNVSNLKAQAHDVSFNINKADSSTRIISDGNVQYGICGYAHVGTESSPSNCLWLKVSSWRPIMISGACPLKIVQCTATDPGCTWVEPTIRSNHYINTSSSNAEYPLVFSTCCATPAAGNRTLYNDSANNLMYNPSSNTLTACCVRGNSRVISGNPLSCTSTQTGSGGVDLGGGGIIELYHATPFIDFHTNYTCDDYSHRLIANNGYLRVTATNAIGCTAATRSANFDFCSNGTFCANKVNVGSSYAFYASKADNSGRPTLHLLRDITCAVCGSACGWSAIGKACIVRYPSPNTGYTASRCVDFHAMMQYGVTGVSNARIDMFSQYADIKPVIVTRNDGCVYFAMCAIAHGCMTYDMQGACCVICEVCYNGTAYTDANGTYTIAKEGSLAEIASCVSNATNATCFGGCTYAQAKADIAGSVETTPYTCINDVNAGAQDILMTSSTGTLGLVNASTGTNACPLTYNPSTGELATKIVRIGELSCITYGANVGDTMIGRMYISNDGFTFGAEHPTCHSSAYNWYYAVACDTMTSLGKCARACCTSVAVGYDAWSADKGGVAVGCHATALGCNSVAVGIASCAANCAVAIGKSAFASQDGDLAIGLNAKTCEYGVGYFRILKDIRYSGYRETTFCIACNAEECRVYTVLNSLFCTNPAQYCPGYGHDEWPAYGINGCCGCFYGSIRSDRWGAGQQCCFFRMGSHTFTDGCTATVGCNMFVTVIAPVKE